MRGRGLWGEDKERGREGLRSFFVEEGDYVEEEGEEDELGIAVAFYVS